MKLTSTAAPDLTTRAETSYCKVDRPITYDRLKDTEETIAQVRSHNDVFDGLCLKAQQ